MTKFNNKYRIESTRLQHWDYGKQAAYFVTINTANRKHFFGKIENQQFIPSKIGEIVAEEWIKTPEIRPDMNLELGEFSVMPNHFHGIIFIGNNAYNGNDAMHGRDALQCFSTENPVSTNKIDAPYKNEFGPQFKNLSSIIRGFKSTITVQARQIDPKFGWQAKFHDRIIRDHNAYENITKYIRDNPKNWKEGM